MSKQTGSPDWLEGICQRPTNACIRACKEAGTIGNATAVVTWEGDYSFSKDGGFDLDLDIGADIPDSVPVDADAGVEVDSKRKKQAKGKLRVEYRVFVKTEGG